LPEVHPGEGKGLELWRRGGDLNTDLRLGNVQSRAETGEVLVGVSASAESS
jgi:hypothetical protein